MSQNDTLKIGPYFYTVLKRDGDFALLYWIESTGIEREMWVNMRRKVA